jgi:hypothetical protein
MERHHSGELRVSAHVRDDEGGLSPGMREKVGLTI